MNNSSRTLRIALPLGLLAALLWGLPFVLQGLPMLDSLSQNSTRSPTQMPPSGSTLVLNDSTPCRVQPADSANLVTTLQAGTTLPIVAQFQAWYLVQVNVSASKYNRCGIYPGATTVEGAVAAIPVVTNPEEVALFPAVDATAVPIPGQPTPRKPVTGQGTPGIPISGQPTPNALSAGPGTPGVTDAEVAAPGAATTEVIPGIVVPPTLVPILTPIYTVYPLLAIPPGLPGTIICPPMSDACYYYPPLDAQPSDVIVIQPTEPLLIVHPTDLILVHPTHTPLAPIIVQPTDLILIHPTHTPLPPVIIQPTQPPVIVLPTDIIIIRPTEPPVIVWPTAIIIIRPTP